MGNNPVQLLSLSRQQSGTYYNHYFESNLIQVKSTQSSIINTNREHVYHWYPNTHIDKQLCSPDPVFRLMQQTTSWIVLRIWRINIKNFGENTYIDRIYTQWISNHFSVKYTWNGKTIHRQFRSIRTIIRDFLFVVALLKNRLMSLTHSLLLSMDKTQ